jgi:protein gp37
MRAQIAQDVWNPWHGCHKFSEGCLNCYVYRRDTKVGRDASTVTKNQDFDLPVKTKREGGYRIEPNTRLYSCMTSDFFLPDAD